MHLELFINLVSEVAEEVIGILLLSDVHWLAPQLEGLPEVLWSIELELALQQMAKYTLDLWQDTGEREREREVVSGINPPQLTSPLAETQGHSVSPAAQTERQSSLTNQTDFLDTHTDVFLHAHARLHLQRNWSGL